MTIVVKFKAKVVAYIYEMGNIFIEFGPYIVLKMPICPQRLREGMKSRLSGPIGGLLKPLLITLRIDQTTPRGGRGWGWR